MFLSTLVYALFANCCVCRLESLTPLLCRCAGEGCDEGCDGGPSADQQWEDPAELGSSEHAAVSSGGFPLSPCIHLTLQVLLLK